MKNNPKRDAVQNYIAKHPEASLRAISRACDVPFGSVWYYKTGRYTRKEKRSFVTNHAAFTREVQRLAMRYALRRLARAA